MNLFPPILLDLGICVLIADFLSGLLHWAEDTYAVPGYSKWWDEAVVIPNIAHHRFPGRIANEPYLNNVAVTGVLALISAAVLFLFDVKAWQPYITLLIAAQMNQTHAWAHTRRVPAWVAALQSVGLIQSTGHHSIHHQSPYMVRYCTGTNYLNPILDGIGFWRGLERLIPFPVKRGSAERSGF